MSGRQSVRVTYAHKRRRVQHAGKRPLSSPLEVLPPEMGDLTRTHMVRRMLKRSRRAALSNQSEDRNVEHVREHLAKRIKRTQERVSSVEPSLPSDASLTDSTAFETPFPSSKSAQESVVVGPLVPEQLSPVPVAKRFIPRTSSRSLKENGVHSHVLASPFSSRPGSTAPSPKHKERRSSRRVSRGSLITKSRTHPSVSKEEARRISRKGSTVSLKDANREPPASHVKHQRYLSSPSAAYMRPQFAQEDWIAPPEAFSRTFNDYDEVPSPSGSVHGNASFYVGRPQSCSTPAISRPRRLPHLRGQQKRTENLPSFSPPEDPTESLDVEMMDDTVPPRHQTIHLSRNSIFSSSDEFTLGSLPAINHDETVESNHTSRNDAPDHVVSQVLAYCEPAERSRADRALTGSFVAEYDIFISDLPSPPTSTAVIKALDSEDILESSVGVHPFSLSGTSPARGRSHIIHTCKSPATLVSPPPLPKATVCSPSSPASDLALEFRSMDICGDVDTHPDGEMHRPSASVRLQTYSRSLRDMLAVVEPAIKKSVRRGHTRNRAGTIRASDFAKNGICSSGVASGKTASSPSKMRRTRSGTIVGPDSKLATNASGPPGRATRGAPTARLAVVQSGSEDEDEDELLLKGAWIEDLEYLGLAVPQSSKDAEADEMNLGGLWPALQLSPPRRLGLRRR